LEENAGLSYHFVNVNVLKGVDNILLLHRLRLAIFLKIFLLLLFFRNCFLLLEDIMSDALVRCKSPINQELVVVGSVQIADDLWLINVFVVVFTSIILDRLHREHQLANVNTCCTCVMAEKVCELFQVIM
jgi:hypothetical protein